MTYTDKPLFIPLSQQWIARSPGQTDYHEMGYANQFVHRINATYRASQNDQQEVPKGMLACRAETYTFPTGSRK